MSTNVANDLTPSGSTFNLSAPAGFKNIPCELVVIAPPVVALPVPNSRVGVPLELSICIPNLPVLLLILKSNPDGIRLLHLN